MLSKWGLVKKRVSEYWKKYFYINGFALSLAVKQRLMEQLWNYLSHVCLIFCKFQKNLRFFRGLLNLLFHCFTLFGKFLNFAEVFQFSLICSFHKNHTFSWGLPYLPVYCFSLMQWIFIIFCNFCNCMQTWT